MHWDISETQGQDMYHCVIKGDVGWTPWRHIQQGEAGPKLHTHSIYRYSYRDIRTNMFALFPNAPSEMSGPLCSCDRNAFRFLLGPPDVGCSTTYHLNIKECKWWPNNLNPHLLAWHTVKCDCQSKRIMHALSERRQNLGFLQRIVLLQCTIH